MKEIVLKLEELLQEKMVIVGMGNYFRRDDGVGPYIVNAIENKLMSDNVSILNVSDVIESYLYQISMMNCKNVMIIDSISSKPIPGTVLFGELNNFTETVSNYSTHKPSLYTMDYMLKDRGKKIYLMGICVKDTSFGIGLSPQVKKSADIIKDLLIKTINNYNKNHTELLYECHA